MRIVTQEIVQPLSALEWLTQLAELRPEVCGNDCDPHGNPLPLEFGLFVDPNDFGNWATVDPAAEPGLEPIDLAYLQHTLQEAIAREGLSLRIENDPAGFWHVAVSEVTPVSNLLTKVGRVEVATSKWAAIAMLEAFVEHLSKEGSADA